MVSPQKQRLSVFAYSDFRSYLIACFEERKRKNPAFSYQAWALKLGLKGNTSLLKVLKGQREMGPAIQARLEADLKLSAREQDYFRALVSLSKSKDANARSLLMNQLARLHPTRRFKEISESQFSAIAAWYGYALRQITRVSKFDADPDWIAAQFLFPITAREVRAMIGKLVELGFLVRDAKTGALAPGASGLNTTEDVSSEPLKRYHEAVLDNAKRALREIPTKDRQISGLTFAVREEDLASAKEFIRQFEDEFLAKFARPSDADAVYQLETCFYPLTRVVRGTHKGEGHA